FFFQAEDGIRDRNVTGVQTCALPIFDTPSKHFVSAAAIVLNDQKEILLIKGPMRGWEIPGGIVEEGESLKNAAIRETKEESGIRSEERRVGKGCRSGWWREQ